MTAIAPPSSSTSTSVTASASSISTSISSYLPSLAMATEAPTDTQPAPQPDQQQQEQVMANGTAPTDDGPNPLTAPPEPRLLSRKDISLREFMHKMDDYAPIIPDAVTHYYMTKAGLAPPPQTDPRLARLLALATQKFIADVAADAYQYSRIRASNTNANNNPMGTLGAAAGFPIPGQHQGGGAAPGVGGKPDQSKGAAGAVPLGIQRPGYGGGGQGGSQNRTVLTMEDLGMAVGEYGVNVKRSEFYR